MFVNLKSQQTSQIVRTIGKELLQVQGRGDIKLKFGNKFYIIKNVLLVKGLTKNLLSYEKLVKASFTMIANMKKFGDNNIRIKFNGDTIAIGLVEGNIYKLQPIIHQANLLTIDTTNLWHKRLGYLNYRYLGIIKKHLLNPPNIFATKDICDECTQAKIHHTPFPKITEIKSTKPLH